MGRALDLGPDSIVRIGPSCSIGRGSHIVAHQSIDIGADVFTGPYVYITDQNHVYDDPETPIGRQWPRNSPVFDRLGVLARHRARSSCRGPGWAASAWWRAARWCAASSPTTAWWRACPPSWYAATTRTRLARERPLGHHLDRAASGG